MKSIIPVVFTPDENFMVQTTVAILTMLETKNSNTHYHFYILLSDDFNKDKLKYLFNLKELRNDFEYTITYFDSSKFDRAVINTDHVTHSTFYRLMLANIYDFDKCMYHDGDILVYRDLTDMYNVDMTDSYIAGIKTIIQQQGAENDQNLIKIWGFKSMDQYVFAGDLTMNLAKIREDNITDLFIQQMERGFPQQDQDVLNYCCYNHISFLPLKYCMLNRWKDNEELYKYKNQIYTKNEIEEAQKNPAIVHFAGKIVKPWINTRASYAQEWWKYAKMIMPDAEYNEWYNLTEVRTKKRDWTNIIKQVKDLKGDIYIYGYTKYATMLCDILLERGINVVAYVDKYKSKFGVKADLPIIDIDQAIKDANALYIIASQGAYKEIIQQLIDRGVDEKGVFWYEGKTDMYYMSLDSKYYEYEYRDIMSAVLGDGVWKMGIEDIKRNDRKDRWKYIWKKDLSYIGE